MNKAIDEIRWFFPSARINTDLDSMFFPKRFLRMGVVNDIEMMIKYLDTVGVGPHLKVGIIIGIHLFSFDESFVDSDCRS